MIVEGALNQLDGANVRQLAVHERDTARLLHHLEKVIKYQVILFF